MSWSSPSKVKDSQYACPAWAAPVRVAIVLILVVTAFRLWYATRIGLVADETYYWLWSKHLAASYRDKGPAIAWIIALGTRMFGNTVFGIRFFGVILSSATGWLIFTLARRLYDEHAALWCLAMALVIPEMAAGSILMTIDTPSVFFWALAVLLFWNALHNEKISTWFWLGLAIGAGFLAKFTNGVQLICIAFFLLWSREYRRLLISREIFVMGAAFLLASVPIFWWNVETGWVHLIALHSRSGVTNTFHVRPGELLKFIGLQFAVISPLFMAGMVVAAVAFFLKRDESGGTGFQPVSNHQPSTINRQRFLLSQFLPIYALFGFFALNKAGQPNWTVPALVTGIIFTVVFWRELAARNPIWRRCVGASFLITAIVVIAAHVLPFVPLPAAYDPMRRAEGWPDLAAHVQKARVSDHADVLIGCDYQMASLMAFYLPDQPVTYMPPAPYGSSQFTLWPGYRVTPDTRALFVTWGVQNAPKTLQEQFANIRLVDDFWTQHDGRRMKQACIYLCTK